MTTQVSTPSPAAAVPTAPAAPAQPSTAAPPGAPAAAAAAPTQGAAPATSAAPGQPAQPKQQPEFARLVLANKKLEQRIKELEPTASEAAALKAKLEGIKDPQKRYEILEKELGVRYDEWTEHLLKSGKTGAAPTAELPAEVQERLKKLDELEGKLNDREKREATAAEQQQMQAARAVVQQMVEGSEGKYELIGALGQHDAVIAEFRRRVQEAGDADDHEVAAHVEQQIEQVITGQLEKLSKTSKGKALLQKILATLGPKPEGDGHGDGTQASPRANPGSLRTDRRKTVTNDISAQRADGEDFSKLSRAEKRALALKRASSS